MSDSVAKIQPADAAAPASDGHTTSVSDLAAALPAATALLEPPADADVRYMQYDGEKWLQGIIDLISLDLSEPYSIFTYRYFINNWPQLCYLAVAGPDERVVGAIVCKQDAHRSGTQRGYLAMLAVHSSRRAGGRGRPLGTLCRPERPRGGADEAVLETEVTNLGALRLYEGLGFVRDKRLHRYYLNGNDAYRLKLWFKDLVPGEVQPR